MVWDKPPEDGTGKEYHPVVAEARLKPKIVTIPLSSPKMMFQVGQLLARLSQDMMFNAKRDGLSDHERGFVIANRINEVNLAIRNLAAEHDVKMPRRGRRPADDQEQEENGYRTVEPFPSWKSQHPVGRNSR